MEAKRQLATSQILESVQADIPLQLLKVQTFFLPQLLFYLPGALVLFSDLTLYPCMRHRDRQSTAHSCCAGVLIKQTLRAEADWSRFHGTDE